MLTKIDEFAIYICKLGRTLFGEEFIYEKCNYSMQDAYFVKQLFQREEEPAFYKFCVLNVQCEEMEIGKVEFELMEGVNGVEFVCQEGSFLQINDIEKLQETQKCSFGQRNNCRGIRWIGEEDELNWYMVHFFRTRDRECVELFLNALLRFKKAGKISFKPAEIESFEARIAEKIFQLFSYEGYTCNYYPCFDEKNGLYYTCIAFRFGNIKLVLQLRIYSNKQELVCEKPLELWREWMLLFCNRKICKLYQLEMEALERQFIQLFVEKDSASILLCGNLEPDSGISIGEFKTDDVEVAEFFLERLKVFMEKVETNRKLFMGKDGKEHGNRQQKWYV